MDHLPLMEEDNEPIRRKTDVKCTYFTWILCVVFAAVMGYVFWYSNIHAFFEGIDNCANTCGLENKENSNSHCGNNDKTAEKLLLMTSDGIRTCVRNCHDQKNYTQILSRCIKNDDMTVATLDMDILLIMLIDAFKIILLMSIFGLIFSYVLMFLCHFAIKYVIWSVYIGLLLVLTVEILSLMYDWAETYDSHFFPILVPSIIIIFTILTLFYYKKRIVLVEELFNESSKLLRAMPTLYLQPLLNFIALIVTLALFMLFTLVIRSSGVFVFNKETNHTTLDQDNIIMFAYFFNFVVFVWITQILCNCQHFAISRTASQWYFDRSVLQKPFSEDVLKLLWIHQGSIYYASAITCCLIVLITGILVLKAILNCMKSAASNAVEFFCSFLVVKVLFQYFEKNPIIIVAKQSTPLMDSGRKCYEIIFKSFSNATAVNCFCTFVLFAAEIFVVALVVMLGNLIIGESVFSRSFPVGAGAFITFLLVYSVVSTHETVVNTVFICFSEDCLDNDGTLNKPYFMSKDLENVVKGLETPDQANVDPEAP